MSAETLNIVGAGLAGSFVERIAAKNKIKTRYLMNTTLMLRHPIVKIYSFRLGRSLRHEIAKFPKESLRRLSK